MGYKNIDVYIKPDIEGPDNLKAIAGAMNVAKVRGSITIGDSAMLSDYKIGFLYGDSSTRLANEINSLDGFIAVIVEPSC